MDTKLFTDLALSVFGWVLKRITRALVKLSVIKLMKSKISDDPEYHLKMSMFKTEHLHYNDSVCLKNIDFFVNCFVLVYGKFNKGAKKYKFSLVLDFNINTKYWRFLPEPITIL